MNAVMKKLTPSRGLILLCAVTTGCLSAVQGEPNVDEVGCALPPPAVLARVGLSLEVAQAAAGDVDVQGAAVALNPEAISLLSQATLDEQQIRYLDCRARRESPAATGHWLIQMYAFMRTRPTPEQFAAWQRENPSPDQQAASSGVPVDSSTPVSSLPFTSNGLLASTFEGVSVSADRRRATAVIGIQNVSGGPLSVALDHNGELGPFAGAQVSLTDNGGTTWYPGNVSGIEVLPCCNRNLQDLRLDDFVELGAGQRLRLVVAFSDDNNGIGTYRPYNTPGAAPSAPPTTFYFSASAIVTGSGTLQRTQIQPPSVQSGR